MGKTETLKAFAKKRAEKVYDYKRRRKMNTKFVLALAALSYAPLVVAGNEAAYPKEKVAAFVVEKLDLTSLPSAFRPKKERRHLRITVSRRRRSMKTKPSSRRLVERGGWRSRFSNKNPRESTCVLWS